MKITSYEELPMSLAEGSTTADVDAELVPGNLEVLTGVIPGSADPEEEIVVTAHLCHYKPGANDNASGSAAILEMARTLLTMNTTSDSNPSFLNAVLEAIVDFANAYNGGRYPPQLDLSKYSSSIFGPSKKPVSYGFSRNSVHRIHLGLSEGCFQFSRNDSRRIGRGW